MNYTVKHFRIHRQQNELVRNLNQFQLSAQPQADVATHFWEFSEIINEESKLGKELYLCKLVNKLVE